MTLKHKKHELSKVCNQKQTYFLRKSFLEKNFSIKQYK
jgi:hypothetical protein